MDAESFAESLRKMSFCDLYSMYLYSKEGYNKHFGNNSGAKNIIRETFDALCRELDRRTYGCNPYDSGQTEKLKTILECSSDVSIEGEDPTKVIEEMKK